MAEPPFESGAGYPAMPCLFLVFGLDIRGYFDVTFPVAKSQYSGYWIEKG